MSRATALSFCLLLACAAAPPPRWPGWREVSRGPLRFDVPPGLALEELGEGRFRLERADGPPLFEARLSRFCPDDAQPGLRASEPGRFASALGGLPLGQDRFFSFVAGSDRCLLLRFFALWDDGDRIAADRIAASVRWTP